MPRPGLIARRITVKGPHGSYHAIRYVRPTGSLQMFSLSEEDIGRLKQALDGVGQDRASTLAAFFRANHKYVASIAHSTARSMMPDKERIGERGTEAIRDAVHVGEIGLWEALKEYDASKGAKFSTFATNRIKARVSDVFKVSRRKLSRELPMDEAQEIPEELGSVPGPEEKVLDKMMLEQVYGKLGEREKTVAKMRAAGYKFNEIASVLGVTQGRVTQIYEKIETAARQVARKASQGTSLTLVKAAETRGSAAGVVIDVQGRIAVRLPGGEQ